MKKRTGPKHQERMPIPSDWDGDSWFCIQMQWPASPQYIALLAGVISQPSRGWWWNEKTGSVIDAQQIGLEIYNRNIAFTPCGAEPPPCDGGHYELVYVPASGCGDDESEDCMSCVLPPGVLRVDQTRGILQYLTCEGWQDVPYWDGTAIVDPPPDDENIDPVVGYGCNKAAGMAQVFAPIAQAMSGMEAETTTQAKILFVRQTIPGFTATGTATTIVSAYSALDATDKALLASVDFEGWLRCAWSKALDNTSDLTAIEWQQMGAALAFVFTSDMQTFIKAMMAAIGQSQMAWYARVSYDETADCTCPGEEVPYTGSIQFLGTFYTITHPTWVTTSEVENNGKRLHIVWEAPAGPFQSDGTMRPEVTFNGVPHTNFKVLAYPSPGSDFPKKDWYDTGCETGNPASTWTQEQFGATFNESWSTPAPGQRLTTAVSSDGNPHGFTYFEFFVRKCNEIPGGMGEQPAITYDFYLEIVEIDGVPV